MDFELPVIYNNRELVFHGKFLDYGYSSKIEIEIEGTKVLFEPDEERNWRAVVSYEEVQANRKPDSELLKAVVEAIERVLR